MLAAALAGQDRLAEARAALDEATGICRDARPPRDYELAVHRHNLADIHHRAADLAAAERCYRQALAGKEHLVGPEHPEVALVANNLAAPLQDQGRWDAGRELLDHALAIAERTLPPDHPTTAAIRHNLTRASTVQ